MIFVVRLEFCVADLDVPKETLLDDIEVAPTMLMLSPYEYREFVIYIGPERIAALLTVDEPAIGRIEAPVDHGEIQRIIEYDRAEMDRSEEHTSELQSLMRISYAVFCLKKKKNIDR